MDNPAEQIGNVVADKKELLNGFKVLGVFPFYLTFIKFSTHIELMVLKERIQSIAGGKVPDLNDFHNPKLLKAVFPLIEKYIVTALINKRFFGFMLRPFIAHKVRHCGHRHVHNLYKKIMALSDPGFFFDYWTHLLKANHVLLKTGSQSLEPSVPTKKSSEEPKKR